MKFSEGRLLRYNDDIIRLFTIASLFWAIIGLGFGVFIALQLSYPELNLHYPWSTFGRLRPAHTTGVIFAFGGIPAFSYTCYIRLYARYYSS
jgi:cytochrome c oxidase cbb3-type subunit 1